MNSTPAYRRPLLATLAAALLLLLFGGRDPALAETEPNVAPYARGLLWRIERAGRPPSYLFGTIHLADPRVTTLPPPVAQALGESRHFLMELVPDADGLALLAESMMFTDQRTLTEIVGRQLYGDIEAEFRRRGMPTAMLAKYKPWAVAVILSLPATVRGGVPLDMQLQLKAAEQGKTVEGLETAAEQIAVFDDLGLEEQRALLEATLREQQAVEHEVETLVQVYLSRDLLRLRAVAEAYARGDEALKATVRERLLVARNVRMVERMQARLEQGGAFIAVGAAHLPGDDGLLALLEKRGYRVQAVY